MFQIIRPRPDRLDIESSGSIDGNGMSELLDELLQKSAGMERGRVLLRLRDFQWPTPGALGLELVRAPELFDLSRRFERVAVLVDEPMVHTLSRIDNALMPGMEIRAFNLHAEADAEAWLAQ